MKTRNTFEVVEAIIGTHDIWCSTEHDNEVEENLKEYYELTFKLCAMIGQLSQRQTDYRGSAQVIGKKAERMRTELIECLQDYELLKGVE